MPKGITYLGKHSYNDFGITMSPVREVGIPNKKKTKLTVPFSNATYDYSELFGSQVYEERTIKYTFNIANRGIRTKEEMNWVKTSLINWFMNSHGKQPLYDDNYPGVHFLAEVEGGASFSENWNFGFLEVTFTAYPFMISNNPEGSDIWDDFNFLFGIVQETKFDIPGTQYDYNVLTPGTQATISGWATGTVGIPGQLLDYVGVTGTILARRDLSILTARSMRAYTIEGIDHDVIEQDILQACAKHIDVTLVNPGTPAVFPEISLVKNGTTPAISIENLDTGIVYSFTGNNPTNYLFQLNSGENNLRLYALDDQTVEFTFSKELI